MGVAGHGPLGSNANILRFLSLSRSKIQIRCKNMKIICVSRRISYKYLNRWNLIFFVKHFIQTRSLRGLALRKEAVFREWLLFTSSHVVSELVMSVE
ncbi:hypothetical protein J4Q44_G00149910 [Coregonus suidteri]|uniref:Uncharacterized protein n=1 Tax=Coregonus suidteri TaxID=861788 RepID=A0AAN8LWI9_9TELE